MAHDSDHPPAKRPRVDVETTIQSTKPQGIDEGYELQPAIAVFWIPLVMDHIVDFLRAANDKCWTRRGCASAFLKTVTSLCCSVPLGAVAPPFHTRYGPSNQVFWREKLFQYFNFTVDAARAYNFPDDNDMDVGGDPTWERQHQAVEMWQQRRDAGLLPTYEGGERCLVEDLVAWKYLHVWHRPSQYGYLTEIQEGRRALCDFPDDVDGFWLFKNLVFLVDKLRMHAVTKNPKTSVIKERAFCPVLLGCVTGSASCRVHPRVTTRGQRQKH